MGDVWKEKIIALRKKKSFTVQEKYKQYQHFSNFEKIRAH